MKPLRVFIIKRYNFDLVSWLECKMNLNCKISFRIGVGTAMGWSNIILYKQRFLAVKKWAFSDQYSFVMTNAIHGLYPLVA